MGELLGSYHRGATIGELLGGWRRRVLQGVPPPPYVPLPFRAPPVHPCAPRSLQPPVCRQKEQRGAWLEASVLHGRVAAGHSGPTHALIWSPAQLALAPMPATAPMSAQGYRAIGL